MFLVLIISAALGLVTVLSAVPLLLRCSRTLAQGRVRDLHHTHKAPIPRWGGLALAAAFVLTALLSEFYMAGQSLHWSDRCTIVFASLAMFGVGFLDDLRPLGAKRKFLAQILIATLVWFSGIEVSTFRIPLTNVVLQIGIWGWLFTVLWLVGMTNLINLIDGVDGLAGGICLMLMGLTAYLSFGTGTCEVLACGMAGGLIGFLRYNFPPARIYLGDGGAYFLGFQIGLFAIINSQKGTIVAALIAPLFVLTLPIADTALAILRRGLRGLPLFRPDKHHIHHRLLSMGLSRRRVVISIYGMTMVFLVLGLIAFWSQGRLVPVLGGIALLIMLVCAGNLSFSREWFAVGRVVGNSLDMRREIHYALTLTRWLALEGTRGVTLETLWDDLVFAAQKLGFKAVTLTLADGCRSWKGADANGETVSLSFPTGIAGNLELRAPAENVPGEAHSPAANAGKTQTSTAFEIVGELLAEGWLKAVQEWHGGRTVAVAFTLEPAPVEDRAGGNSVFRLFGAKG